MVVHWVFDYIHVTQHVQNVRMFNLRCMGLLSFGVRMLQDVRMLLKQRYGCNILFVYNHHLFCVHFFLHPKQTTLFFPIT